MRLNRPSLLLALTACGSGQFANPFLVSYTLTLTPASIEIPQGASG